jgi:succinate-semialdehyde dehydrogenase/glutarate-semialdehyde dehydrogenase
MLRSIFPYDQSLIAEFPLMTDKQLATRLDNAADAFRNWKKTSIQYRTDLFLKTAQILRANKTEYARLITHEMGKITKESLAEIEKCAAGCEFYAKSSAAFLADHEITTDAKKSFVVYQPTGAVLAVMPWNFPFWQVFRFAIPALMAGNVGLLKHAPNVTQCSLQIEKIFLEAGFPEHVFQSLLVDVDKTESIVQHDVIQGIALTGSEGAGSSVASIAGKHIKKTVLELGGSDPFIVLHDADLEYAATIATQSRMQNAGQSCIAAKRFIVEEQVQEEFTYLFLRNIEKLKQGNPFEADVTTGPVARLDLAEKIEGQMNTAVNAGAKKLIGGNRNGCNVQPSLLVDVKKGMSVYEEETFGPLAALITVRDEEQAIQVANDHRYGLGGSVWTRDIERGQRIAREVESGSMFINALMHSDSRLPFGGVKKSGYGRELAEDGIKEFVNKKTIFIADNTNR